MPSEKILQKKQAEVAELADTLKGSVAGVLVDYKGISVADDTKLRKDLREAGVVYKVLKNNIMRRAMDEAGFQDLNVSLVGTTALAVSKDDAVSAAKILYKYAEDSKGAFSVKAGFVEGNVIDADGVKSLAKLPSRDELVAQALRGFNAPLAGFANVLNGNIRGLVIALGQIAQKSEQSA